MRAFAIMFCGLKLLAQQDVATNQDVVTNPDVVDQSVAINGTIVETGTGIPVAGAKVVLRYATSPVPIDSTGTYISSVTSASRISVSKKPASQ